MYIAGGRVFSRTQGETLNRKDKNGFWSRFVLRWISVRIKSNILK